jgi:transposase-like protein
MGTGNYSDEFKRDAVQQIAVRGAIRFGWFPGVWGEVALALEVDEAFRGPSPEGGQLGP